MASSETIQIFLFCYLAAIITQNAHAISATIQYGSLYELWFQCIVVGVSLVLWGRAKESEHRCSRYGLFQHESARHPHIQNRELEKNQDIKPSESQTKIDAYLSGKQVTTGNVEPNKQTNPKASEEALPGTTFIETKDSGVVLHNLLNQIEDALSDLSDHKPNSFTATTPKPHITNPTADATSVLASTGEDGQVGNNDKKKKRKRRSKPKITCLQTPAGSEENMKD